MRKWLVIFVIMLITLVGCSKKEKESQDIENKENIQKWAQHVETMFDEYEHVMLPKIEAHEYYKDVNFTYGFGGNQVATRIVYSLDEEENRAYAFTVRPILFEPEREFESLMRLNETSIEVEREGWLVGFSKLQDNVRKIFAVKDGMTYTWLILDEEVENDDELIAQEFERLDTSEDSLDILREIQENLVEKISYLPFEQAKKDVSITFEKNYRVDGYHARMDIKHGESNGLITKVNFITKEYFEGQTLDEEQITSIKTKNGIEIQKHELPNAGPEKTYYSLAAGDYIYKFEVVDYDGDYDWSKQESEVLQTIDQMDRQNF